MSGWVDGLLTGLLQQWLDAAVRRPVRRGPGRAVASDDAGHGSRCFSACRAVPNVDGAAAAALAGSVSGDACSYLLGCFGANLLPMRWRDSTAGIRATRLFDHWGGWSVFLTRFLFTPAALPVNLLAGSTRYAWPRFMTAVLAGQNHLDRRLRRTRAPLRRSLGGDRPGRRRSGGAPAGVLLVVAGVATLAVRRLRRGSALQARHPAPGSRRARDGDQSVLRKRPRATRRPRRD